MSGTVIHVNPSNYTLLADAYNLAQGYINVYFESGVYNLKAPIPLPDGHGISFQSADISSPAQVVGTTTLDYSCFKPLQKSDPNYGVNSKPSTLRVCKLPDEMKKMPSSCTRGNCIHPNATKQCDENELTVFFNDKRAHLARFPNLDDHSYLQAGSSLAQLFDGVVATGYPSGNTFGIQGKGNKSIPSSKWTCWSKESDLYVAGSLTNMSTEWEKVPVRVNKKGQRFSTSELCRDKAVSSKYGFYVTNALSELDRSDEYYIDSKNGRMYALASAIKNTTKIEIATYSGKVFEASSGNEDIVFNYFALSKLRGRDLFANDQRPLFISKSNFTDLVGPLFNVGENVIFVQGSTFKRIGSTIAQFNNRNSMFLISGAQFNKRNSMFLISGFHGNIFDGFSWYNKVHQPAIRLTTGSGYITVTSNEFSNAPHAAIEMCGTMHSVNFNKFHNLVTGVEYSAAVYCDSPSTLSKTTEVSTFYGNYLHDFGFGKEQHAMYLNVPGSRWNIGLNMFSRIGSNGTTSSDRGTITLVGTVGDGVYNNLFYKVYSSYAFLWKPSFDHLDDFKVADQITQRTVFKDQDAGAGLANFVVLPPSNPLAVWTDGVTTTQYKFAVKNIVGEANTTIDDENLLQPLI
ncbi:hypothetical protein HDU80_009625 [Chytriomyces hyalinus]|nr:hypothetical protein HDU80_009625 [Chytriomyces hyalinus]